MVNPQALLIADSARGIYIPQYIATMFSTELLAAGLPIEDWHCLKRGPDNSYYWDAWEACNSLTISYAGKDYYLHQDGDAFLVPLGQFLDD